MHVEILSFMSFCGRLLSGNVLLSVVSSAELSSLPRHRIRPHRKEARHVPFLVPLRVELNLSDRPDLWHPH